MFKPLLYLIALILLNFVDLNAQDQQDLIIPDHIPPENIITIGEISISGNRQTRTAIILREIPLQSGEKISLSDLVKRFQIARKQLLNTTLFTQVVVAARNISGELIDVEVEVKERNYLFPLPHSDP